MYLRYARKLGSSANSETHVVSVVGLFEWKEVLVTSEAGLYIFPMSHTEGCRNELTQPDYIRVV